MTASKSFAFAVLAILFISPDSLMIKLADMPTSMAAFWRSFGIMVGLGLVFGAMGKPFFSNNRIVWVASVVSAVGQITFVLALEHASVANVLVLVAALPTIFSVILSYVMMREKTKMPTLIASLMCIFGVFVLAGQGFNIQEFYSLGFVVINSFFMALSLTMTKKYTNIDMMQAYFLGSVMATIFCLINAGGDVFITPHAINYVYIISCGLIFLTGYYVFASIGGKKTPSPIFALLFLLETVIGTILAVIFIGEIPSLYTVIGGLIVLTSLALHSIWHLRDIKKIKA